jgi:hypothetical protein
MNVLMISPGFPRDLGFFTRGLAEVGATVFGIGDGPLSGFEPELRAALADYHQVRSLWDEDAVIEEVRTWLRGRQLDRVECLWEPGVVLAARVREAFGIPGLTVEQAVPFRDKEAMKVKLDAAGVRTPRHARATSEAEMRAAAEEIGFPLIIKPIDGAGSADTYPVHEASELDEAIRLTAHVPEVSVEEFIRGEEFTFDTVSANGDVLFQNIAWYRPKPLVARLNPWINPQAIALRDTDVDTLAVGKQLGFDVLRALEFESGFTHMEWFLTDSGEAVFGEIGARSPGGRLVHVMNYSCDIDLFAGWAEAVCYGRLSQDTSKKYNAAVIFYRAQGDGTIQRIEGLDTTLAEFGEHVAAIDLVRIGEPRRDYRQVVEGDGWIVCRHPELQTTLRMADRLATEIRIFAA